MNALLKRIARIRGYTPDAPKRPDRCRSGRHEYTPNNTYQDKRGRKCRACRRERDRARYRAQAVMRP